MIHSIYHDGGNVMERTKEAVQTYIKTRSEVTENGCWEWKKGLNNGYGNSKWLGEKYAHRVSYRAFHLDNAPIPDGLCVCHHCDNRKCVNPSHFFLGTKKENTADMFKKGRNRTAPKRGESHYLASKTDAEITEIVKEYLQGGVSYRALGEKHGEKTSTISAWVRGQNRPWCREAALAAP
jgi:hypothetical protein